MSAAATRRPVAVTPRWRLGGSLLGWTYLATGIVCSVALLAAIAYIFWPVLEKTSTLGSHDWDQMESHRYLVAKSIRRFRQFPFWDPYTCGGHPAWGGFESAPNVVSLWLPAYLLWTLPVAMRVEMIGSTLVCAMGAWLLASRFTRSRSVCLLVAVLFSLNSRWTMQVAVGHGWHEVYAYVPWVLFFYDRAVGVGPPFGGRCRADIVLTAVCLSMLVYAGGIYPLPHAAVALAGYALILSANTRSLVPTKRMVACVLLGLGFAAPRLFPIIEVLRRFPRLVDSTETMDLRALVAMLTSRDQDQYSMPAPVSPWQWHEYGMYIGRPALCAIVAGVLAARTPRERSLRAVGLLLLVIAFGSFAVWAPWSLLHSLPVFASQHVPSRWMLPSLLLVASAAASCAERVLCRTGRMRGLIELGMMVVVLFIVRDICDVDHVSLAHAFERPMPAIRDSVGEFRTYRHVPQGLEYDGGEWAPSTLTALIANIGSIDCNTFPGFNNSTRGQNGRSPGMGAHAVGEVEYRGEAFVAEGGGTAQIVRWAPDAMEVRVEGGRPGDHVVLNQNWDPGWRANGAAAIAWHDAVASEISSRSTTVRFRYRPQTLWLGMLVFLVSACAPAVAGRGRRLKRWSRGALKRVGWTWVTNGIGRWRGLR
jgi:hypothetical protein